MECNTCLARTEEYKHKCNAKDCRHWINKLEKLEKLSGMLHTAICNSVNLMNMAPIENNLVIKAKDTLRQVLIDYADTKL